MLLNLKRWLSLLLVVSAVAIAGCSSNVADSTSTTTPVATSPQPTNTMPNTPKTQLATLEGKATVVMVIKGSPITIEVDGTKAPVTAGNFIDLVQQGFYDGLVFHRVVKNPEPFVAQGGDPQSRDSNFPTERLGTGGFIDPKTGKERYIPLEITPAGASEPVYSKTLTPGNTPALRHSRGAVAMARAQFPDSASSQFYIALTDLSFLDGNYAVFGYVTEGMDVVDSIKPKDIIDSAKVTQGLEYFKAAGQ